MTGHSTRDPAYASVTAAQMEQVREAAREAVEFSSLRSVATDIGIGHSTLFNFVNGVMPHPRVRRILYGWYVRDGGASAVQAVELDRLVRELPEPVRARFHPRLAVLLAGGYVEGDVEMPAWLV